MTHSRRKERSLMIAEKQMVKIHLADEEDPFLTSTRATRSTGMEKILILVKK